MKLAAVVAPEYQFEAVHLVWPFGHTGRSGVTAMEGRLRDIAIPTEKPRNVSESTVVPRLHERANLCGHTVLGGYKRSRFSQVMGCL